jgi:hypothetical protein
MAGLTPDGFNIQLRQLARRRRVIETFGNRRGAEPRVVDAPLAFATDTQSMQNGCLYYFFSWAFHAHFDVIVRKLIFQM